MRLVTAGLIGLLTASSLPAQEPVRQEREHTVRVGDTLWDLAGFYFSNPFQWRTIYEANTSVVEDPHWIYPEEVLVIPGIAPDVQPRTELVGGPPDRPLRTVFYRPPPRGTPTTGGDPTVLAEPNLERMPVRLGEFNSAPYLYDPDDLRVLGTFMRAVRDVYAGRGVATTAHPQDRVFLSYGSRERPQVGERLLLARVGRRVDGARRGDRIIYPTAVLRVDELTRDVMQATIETQYESVHPGQIVIPLPMYPDFRVESAEPVEGGFDIEGHIMEFVDDRPLYGRTALGFIDRGSRDGVNVGDVFEAYLPERRVRERRTGEFRARIERLPPERVGELRVVRVTDRYATVKVIDLELASMAEELPVRRIGRIP